MAQLCDLCLSNAADRTIEHFGLCADCEEESPRIVRGIEYEIGGGLVPDRYMNEEPTHWYSFAGLRKTSHIRRAQPPEDIQTYLSDFLVATSRLGVKRTMTHILLHHYIGSLALMDSGYSNGEAGLPPRMIQFGLTAAGSVTPISSPARVALPNIEELTRLCDLDSEVLSEWWDRYEFRLSQRIISNLECMYALSTAEQRNQKPDSKEYEALNAATTLDLDSSGFAYPKQYLEAMERRYTPFQYVFLEKMELDIVKSVSWARQLLEVFRERIRKAKQQIRWYQVDALCLVGDLVEPVFDSSGPSLEDNIPTSELRRAEQISWTVLIPLVENYLWISKKQLVENIAPHSKHGFQRFLDRISQPVGDFSVKGPGGFMEFEKYPLIQYNDSYLIPQIEHFSQSMANTFVYDLMDWGLEVDFANDDNEPSDLDNLRGEVTEKWVEDLVKRAFGETNTYRGVQRSQSDDNDIDVLAISGDKALIVEAKSKSLTKQALQGDMDKIHSDFERGVKKAADQLETKINLLEDGEYEGKVPGLEKVSEFLPVVAVNTEYGSFSTTAYPELLDNEFVPYIVDVYGLDVITRVLTPDGITQYVRDRIYQNVAGEIRSMDEMDYLGLFLKGPWPESAEPISSQDLVREGSENVQIIAPIHGAARYVAQYVPELAQFDYYPLLTLEERIKLDSPYIDFELD